MPQPPSHTLVKKPRSKVVAALLALSFGVLGAHAWYLRRPYAWIITVAALCCMVLASRYPVWFENPAFFLLLIPAVDGFIRAAVYSLMADEKFDRLYNPDGPRANKTGVAPVLVAIATVLWGAAVTMFGLAMVVMYVWDAMGWLDISGY